MGPSMGEQGKGEDVTKKMKGFTLLELIMVIVIIGILAAVALPSYVKGLEKMRQREALHWLGAVRQSFLRYYQENISYPGPGWTGLDIDTGGIATGGIETTSGPYYFYYTYWTNPDGFQITASRRDYKKQAGVPNYDITINAEGTIGHPDGW